MSILKSCLRSNAKLRLYLLVAISIKPGPYLGNVEGDHQRAAAKPSLEQDNLAIDAARFALDRAATGFCTKATDDKREVYVGQCASTRRQRRGLGNIARILLFISKRLMTRILEEMQDGERYVEVGRPLSKDRNIGGEFWARLFSLVDRESRTY